MVRRLRTLPALCVLPVLLTACGTEKAGTGSPADPAELASRARASGIAPEHVYVTEVSGFTLAQQSVGVYGGDGFSATYVSAQGGGQLHLRVDRGTMTAESCPRRPVGTASGARTTCERDGEAWYRSGGGQREYAVPKKGHVVRITGEGVERDVLRQAARSVHRPSDAELDTLLPPASGPTEPVERGDLPPVGDGAPDNNVGTSG
ncbi:hypothetical protein [Streptomyces bullii]|uniref:Membrane lipoprotein n=1 Tax=Streptomyces bullii TaxID=349910 RepID=A0ABW0UQC7_9ACTN